jgi:hypothetical protein
MVLSKNNHTSTNIAGFTYYSSFLVLFGAFWCLYFASGALTCLFLGGLVHILEGADREKKKKKRVVVAKNERAPGMVQNSVDL